MERCSRRNRRKKLKIKIEDLKGELLCNRSIKFKDGKVKLDSKQLFGEIIVENTKG